MASAVTISKVGQDTIMIVKLDQPIPADATEIKLVVKKPQGMYF